MIVFNVFSVVVFLVLFKFDFYICKFNQSEQTLQLLVTVFRHGDRTSDIMSNYPKNPYINETYYPYGYGALTNLGKKKMYQLGEEFKKMYYWFLEGPDIPKSIDLLSSDFNRTQCSLQLFLKGLFFTDNSRLECDNSTQFSLKVVTFENNRMLSAPWWFCPKYKLLYKIYKTSPEGRAMEDYYKPLFSYISQKSGLTITSTHDLMMLYMHLTCEKEWGFALPEWTSLVYPEYLRNATITFYKSIIATSAQNQLFGGFLLQKTINDIYKKINKVDQSKMYVYSAHDFTIVSLLSGLNLYHPHIPKYGACVVLELHKINQIYYIKVLYNEEILNKFVDLQIPGCQILCPLEKFVNLVQSNLPEDGDPCVSKNSNEITK